MISISFDSIYLQVGLPAALIGLLLGTLITWLVSRSRRRRLLDELDQAARDLKSQEALQNEREAAFVLQLEENNVLWGVVTNKPEHLTNPLLDLLGVANRIACAVSGDTLAVRKPEPAPLLLGCDIANVEPEQAIYVGDAERDIEAGRRAGMATIAVNYGYITEGDDPREWDPDVIALTTDELTQIVLNAVNLES